MKIFTLNQHTIIQIFLQKGKKINTNELVLDIDEIHKECPEKDMKALGAILGGLTKMKNPFLKKVLRVKVHRWKYALNLVKFNKLT